MMIKNLLLPLGIPLLVAVVAIVGVFLFFRLDWSGDDFTLNLLTEVIGIAFTVGYVEWVVHRYRARQWKKAEQGILLRLRSSVVSWIIQIRVSLGDPGFPDKAMLSALDYSTEYPKLRELMEDLKPTTQQKLQSLDPQGWAPFLDALQSIQRDSETLIMVFEDKLTAKQYETLLDVHSSVSKVLMWCPMLLNSIGQPAQPDSWPPTTQILRNGIAAELADLLGDIIRFGNALLQPCRRVSILKKFWQWFLGD